MSPIQASVTPGFLVPSFFPTEMSLIPATLVFASLQLWKLLPPAPTVSDEGTS